jgi:hypothetical protein
MVSCCRRIRSVDEALKPPAARQHKVLAGGADG